MTFVHGASVDPQPAITGKSGYLRCLPRPPASDLVPTRGRSGRAPLEAYGYQQPAIAGNAGTPMPASSSESSTSGIFNTSSGTGKLIKVAGAGPLQF